MLVRRADLEATALQRQGELGIWASLLGQEAAQIGSGRALRPGDMVFPTYREHGVAWCRGVDPLVLLGLFRGVNLGGWDPAEHNFGLYTIVIGAQTLHATGYAMGIQRDGTEDAVVAYFGDGASSQGDVNEAFVYAAVYNAPVVFFCQNNQWAISEPSEKQSRIPLFRRASGFGFPGIRVDGNDVLASYAVTTKALADARSGQGPSLIEAFTYRMGAHTTNDDPSRYRLAGELEAWKLKDPLERMKAFLYKQQLADRSFFTDLDTEAEDLAKRLRKSCREMPDPRPLAIFDDVYAESTDLLEQQRARVRRLPGFLHRRLVGVGGRWPAMSKSTIAKAVNAGLRKAMENDAKVLIMGEDVGKLGGVFRVTDGLQKDFGEDRVIDTPLAESGIIGTAIGLAMRGFRPVCEIQFDGFVYPAFDQIVSQLAKMRYRSQGNVSMPVTIRIPFGGGIGAVEHHSESPEALFCHIAGLKVVACSAADDAYWMIQQAIASDDPVIFLEPKRRYWEKAEFEPGDAPGPAAPGPDRPAGQGSDHRGVRPDDPHGTRGRRRGRRRGPQHRGARPADAVTARHGDDPRIGAPHPAVGGGARGRRQWWSRGRDRRPGNGIAVLPARGAGAPGHRIRHAVPAVAAGGVLSPRPGPHTRRRRPFARLLTGRLQCRNSSSSSSRMSVKA